MDLAWARGFALLTSPYVVMMLPVGGHNCSSGVFLFFCFCFLPPASCALSFTKKRLLSHSANTWQELVPEEFL